MNAAAKATPIHSLTAAQTAWIEANGIETYKDEGYTIGLGFYCPRNETGLEFSHGAWDMEERDYCQDGDGAKHVDSFPTLKAALKALVSHKQTSCGCCAA